MKKWLLVLGFLIMAVPSWADVTAKIISFRLDDNKNIEVHTQYKIDGVEVVSRYPQEDCDDGVGGTTKCYIWVTRYQILNFINLDGTLMSDSEIKSKIVLDLQQFENSLIQKTYLEKKNQEIFNKNLKTIVGTLDSLSSTTITLKDSAGKDITNLEVKTDGTATATPVIVVP